MIANPKKRAEPVAKLLEAYDGRLVSYHLLLDGDIDFLVVSEIPDDKIADISLVNANAMLVRRSFIYFIPCDFFCFILSYYQG